MTNYSHPPRDSYYSTYHRQTPSQIKKKRKSNQLSPPRAPPRCTPGAVDACGVRIHGQRPVQQPGHPHAAASARAVPAVAGRGCRQGKASRRHGEGENELLLLLVLLLLLLLLLLAVFLLLNENLDFFFVNVEAGLSVSRPSEIVALPDTQKQK